MQKRDPNPRLAMVLILTATAFIAGTTLLAKMIGTGVLGDPLHPLQISHGRFLFAFLAFSSIALVMRPKIEAPNMRIHIGRTVFGWGGVTLMFAAVAFIPLSDATAISFLNPVFGMLLAIPLLGERVGPWRWLAAAMALVGALILLRPGPETFQIAALLPLGAALLMGHGANLHQEAGRPRGAVSNPADQQYDWPDHRDACGHSVLGTTNRCAMGRSCRDRRDDGHGANLFCQRNGAR